MTTPSWVVDAAVALLNERATDAARAEPEGR